MGGGKRTKKGKPSKLKIKENNQLLWKWVKGHSGNLGNELADQLANNAIDEL